MITSKIYLKQSFFTFLFLTLIIGSCTKPKSKMAAYGPVFEKVMKSEFGVFRGLNLGDKLDSVRIKETSKPMETDSGYLYYEMKLDTTGSFNITYNFDDEGLNEIETDIYISNTNKADEVFAKFKSYFDAHYGESESRQGYNVWTVKSEKFGEVRISLSDESSDFTLDKAPRKIALWIYPDKD